jgi:AcrR family transcriptional regulator
MSRPYHHGALRDALLLESQALLAEQGADAISLRELARRLEVSHSAPERHFRNRQELLDALTTRGFEMLTEKIQRALTEAGDDIEDRFRAAAKAYVSFAINNAALLELMFTSKAASSSPETAGAAARLFRLTAEMVGESSVPASSGALGPLRYVVVATLQGIANLVATERIRPEQIDEIIDQAVALFVPATSFTTHRNNGL